MTTNTENILATVLGTDATITDEQRRKVLCVLKGEEDPSQRPPGIGKLYTRKEAAALLGRSPQCLDYYCRKGWLTKSRVGTQQRASFITEEALRAFIKGNETADQT